MYSITSILLVTILVFTPFSNGQPSELRNSDINDHLYNALRNLELASGQNPDDKIDPMVINIICSGLKFICKTCTAQDNMDLAIFRKSIAEMKDSYIKKEFEKKEQPKTPEDDAFYAAINALESAANQYETRSSSPKFDLCQICNLALQICSVLSKM